jgi:hypothetical protein
MLVDIGDGVWVDPQMVTVVCEERGPGGTGSTATGVYTNNGEEKQSVITAVDEVARRINDGLIANQSPRR